MIPRIIHFTVPKALSAQQSACIERAKQLHPDWEVRIWQDPVDVTGFLLAPFHAKANSGAQLADLIRLDVVYAHGGIYLDSDVLLHRSLEPLTTMDNFICSEDGRHLTNAVFAASRHNPLIRLLIADLLAHEPDWSTPPNRTTGPHFFTRVLRWEKALQVLPRASFYPYNYDEEPIDPLPLTYGTHQWAGSWLEGGKVKPHAKQSDRSATAGARLRKLVTKLKSRAAGAIADRLPSHGASYAFGTDLIAKTSRGILMSLPGKDLSVTPVIALRGTYEEAETRFLEKTLRGGDFFVDVGCNVGIHSLTAARQVGPFGRVFAIDANPEVLVHLQRSLVMNWWHDRVAVLNSAVGADTRLVQLQVSDLCLGGANAGLDAKSVFHRTTEALGPTRTTSVQQTRLDDLFPVPQEIKILKIDVEGFEHQVLAGAVSLIENRCLEFVILELLEEVSSGLHALNLKATQDLVDRGYKVCTISDEGDLIAASSLGAAITRSRNIVLARPS